MAASDERRINKARRARGYRRRTEIGIRRGNRDCLRDHIVPAAAAAVRTRVATVRCSREVCEKCAG